MNDTTKNNTPPLSMPPAVPSASEANCKVLLEQWGTGKCAIVEPIFSEQVNGAEIKLGLAGVQVTTINMSRNPFDIIPGHAVVKNAEPHLMADEWIT
jgi:hypothetical protein